MHKINFIINSHEYLENNLKSYEELIYASHENDLKKLKQIEKSEIYQIILSIKQSGIPCWPFTTNSCKTEYVADFLNKLLHNTCRNYDGNMSCINYVLSLLGPNFIGWNWNACLVMFTDQGWLRTRRGKRIKDIHFITMAIFIQKNRTKWAACYNMTADIDEYIDELNKIVITKILNCIIIPELSLIITNYLQISNDIEE